jgi:hypothetical protein
MKRTQFYLPEDLYRILEIEAKKEKRPVADLTRRLLLESLEKRRTHKKNIFLELAKIAGKGSAKTPINLSTRYKEYLYGE